MAEIKPRPAGAAAPASPKLSTKKAAAGPGLPSLEEITPARYARLNSRQRRELTLKLIEFLKTL